MEHEISRHHTGVCLRASLSIDGVVDVAEVVQDVETVGHQQKITLKHAVGKTSVPHVVVLVERWFCISSPYINIEVSVDREVSRKFDDAPWARAKASSAALRVGYVHWAMP